MSNIRELLELIQLRLDYTREDAARPFRWRHAPEMPAFWNSRYAGNLAGSVTAYGYLRIWTSFPGGRRINALVHRLVWLAEHGRLPAGDIDHINGDRSDNRIENLREVSRSTNNRNSYRQSNNKSGVTGVHWYARHQKWAAMGADADGRRVHLGYFADIKDAANARAAFMGDSANNYTARHGESNHNNDRTAAWRMAALRVAAEIGRAKG